MAGNQGGDADARNLSILQSGKYSDMTICCDKIEIRVHQAIVCPASDFFARAFDSDFKEAHTHVISLEDHVDIVKMMLLYLYTHNYDDQVPSFESYKTGGPGTGVAFNADTPDAAVEEACVRMTNNVRVYAIADKYDIPGLKKLAKTKFKDLASPAGLVLRCPAIIYEIYGTTPSEDHGLRGIVTNICVQNVKEIVRSNEWDDAMRTHVDFTIDLLRASVEIVPEKRSKKKKGIRRSPDEVLGGEWGASEWAEFI
ncbi:hypothetical protein MMC22_007168 [Lobaria immixta]|nr:hypothetical protein [Lobaria immixta]